MSRSNPLEQVKKDFGDKAKLVAALQELTTEDLWVARTNKNKGLEHVSNAKLLRLHRIFTEVKQKFGTRAKLIDAICDLAKRQKDEGFKIRLGKYPVPRLYDLYRSTAKRQGVALEKPAAPAAKKAAPRAEAKSEPKAAKAPSKKTAAAKSKAAPKKATPKKA
jgi:hypothetical protein